MKQRPALLGRIGHERQSCRRLGFRIELDDEAVVEVVMSVAEKSTADERGICLPRRVECWMLQANMDRCEVSS